VQKISKYKTATTYAKAWFDAAKEDNNEDNVVNEVRLLLDSIRLNSALWTVLFQPVDDNQEKVKIVTEIAKQADFSKLSQDTLQFMAENDRLNLLKTVCGIFIKLYYEDKGIIEVTVDTAVELTETQNKKLKETLEQKLQAPVVLSYRVKPEVLGGLAIRFNSFLFDDTLAYKLNNLKQVMLNRKTQQ